MLRAVFDQTLPPGVRYSWGGSHKSGWRGVLDGPMPKPTQARVANTTPTQGVHPYGVTPEEHLWYPDQLMSASNVFSTYLEGTSAGSNNKSGRRNRTSWLTSKGWTVSDQISETGNSAIDETVQARWLTRAFLSNLCIGPEPFTDRVNFYRLTSLPGDLGIINSDTRVERQACTTMKGLMADVRHLRVAALPFTDADLPTIAPGYVGRWPLMTIPLLADCRLLRDRFLYLRGFRRRPGIDRHGDGDGQPDINGE